MDQDSRPSRPDRAPDNGGSARDGRAAGDGLGATPDWLDEYDYDLPDSSIARQPAEPRDSSRLLVLDRTTGARTQATFRHLPRFLRAGDLLVVNETRVLKARVFAHLIRTGRPVEVLFSHPDGDGWVALLGPGRRLRSGDRLRPHTGSASPRRTGEPGELGQPRSPGEPGEPGQPGESGKPGETGSPGELRDPLPDLVLDRPEGGGLWRLRAEDGAVELLMERAGHVPLPPYLKREDRALDCSWYQTVYARTSGAVAAPTAGLHFTEPLLASLTAAGVGIARVLLHVGPGTFLPVRAARAEEHRVLPERFDVPEATAAAITAVRANGGRVVAVGTTTVRALETAAAAPHAAGAPSRLQAGSGWTDCTIFPPYQFRAVDAMITNFHLPRSSLLLLVAAFAGRERILAAYAEARDAGFRFYSYGDAMAIL